MAVASVSSPVRRQGFIQIYLSGSKWFAIANSPHTYYCESSGIKTIPTIFFNCTKFADTTYCKKQLEQIKQYPVICKPEEGFKGRGIIAIYGKTQLREALREFRKQSTSFLVQPIIHGTEFRVLVINKTVYVAHTKVMLHVIGDSMQTIEQLLTTNPDTPQDQSFINSELHNRAITEQHILPQGEIFPTHITRKGGKEVYVKTDIPLAIRRWAQQLRKDLTATTLGIDVFIPDDVSATDKYQIIEINASPGFTYLASRYQLNHVVEKIAEDVLRSYFKI